jgi:hypothetical protein
MMSNPSRPGPVTRGAPHRTQCAKRHSRPRWRAKPCRRPDKISHNVSRGRVCFRSIVNVETLDVTRTIVARSPKKRVNIRPIASDKKAFRWRSLFPRPEYTDADRPLGQRAKWEVCRGNRILHTVPQSRSVFALLYSRTQSQLTSSPNSPLIEHLARANESSSKTGPSIIWHL